MQIRQAQELDSVRWDEFVISRPDAVNYQRWRWRDVMREGFGWSSFYLLAEDEAAVRGVLPLTWVKSRLFGNLLCSVAFFSSGGILADSDEARQALFEEAVALARKLKVDSLELRHSRALSLPIEAKTSKLSLACQLDADSERMLQALDKKVRADIRKSQKSGFEIEFGGREFLDDFYRVFAIKMRELGTPVYGRKFFDAILRAFPNETFVCRVRKEGKLVAASFLTAFRERMEVNWSSSLDEFSSLKPNMFMYWNILSFAAQRGFRVFDFGRSAPGSGTHKFKQQWNTEETPLYWHTWTRNGASAPELNAQNPKYSLAIKAWQRMPLFLTNLIGPRISRCLP